MAKQGQRFGIPPWHMWGTSGQVIVLHPSSSGVQYQQSKQLAKLNYARPDTWSFLFAAVILKAPDAGMNPINITVDFDVFAGLGRSRLSLQESQGGGGAAGFCRFVFSYSTPGAAQIGRTKWATSVPSPILDDATTDRFLIDHFPAQDIQCGARVSTVAVDAQDTSTIVEVHSYFAPRTHIRPEWFSENPVDQFRGDEQGGT